MPLAVPTTPTVWTFGNSISTLPPPGLWPGFAEGEPITNDQLLTLPCDILVPAALERQITEANAGKIQCRILAEAANGPTTPEADVILNQRPEIFIIPDVLCNAGGVVVSYFEWVQDLQSFFWGETEVVDKLFRILETAFTQVVSLSRKQKLPLRLAALSLGIQRVQEAKRMRRAVPVASIRDDSILCFGGGQNAPSQVVVCAD